jgi:hypothetical protein
MGRFGVMTKKKQSLKLPIFLMVAPIAGIILSIFLYAIVNFIFSGMCIIGGCLILIGFWLSDLLNEI